MCNRFSPQHTQANPNWARSDLAKKSHFGCTVLKLKGDYKDGQMLKAGEAEASLLVDVIPLIWMFKNCKNETTWADFATGKKQRFGGNEQTMMTRNANRGQCETENLQAYVDELNMLFSQTASPVATKLHILTESHRKNPACMLRLSLLFLTTLSRSLRMPHKQNQEQQRGCGRETQGTRAAAKAH